MKSLWAAIALSALANSAHAADAGSPRMNFVLQCSGCHGQAGAGNAAAGVPDMRGRLAHFLKVQDGREFLAQVPGVSQSSLSNAGIAELLNWLLTTFCALELPADFVPYTAEEIGRLRAAPLADVPGRRAEIVARIRKLEIAIE